MARTLRPGLFENAAALLAAAEVESVEEPPAPLATPRGPRAWARVSLRTAGGGRGVFVLVDEPSFLLVTDDPEIPRITGRAPGLERSVRVREGALEVVFRAPLPVEPVEGARIERVALHHDWLLYAIESLEGFDRFLEEVRSAAAGGATAEDTP